MARMPRLVVPGYPHHVTQRGNRRMKTFFSDSDYRHYLELLSEYKIEAGVDIWAYCLMPNHVHIVAVPEQENGLADLFRQVHRHYSRYINFREKWKGHLWQERFHSFVMDEKYLLAAVRYIELNPVRASLCKIASGWRWSSVHAHLSGTDDGIVSTGPMLSRVGVGSWLKYLQEDGSQSTAQIRKHGSSGRPAGSNAFVELMEIATGRNLKRKRPGPKPQAGN